MIEIENISVCFGNHMVLENINMEIRNKEIVALLGPSGCGKTTLMKILSGIQKPNSGRIKGIKNNISYVFQDDRLLPWRTVWDNISVVSDKGDTQEIQCLINQVGLKGFEKHYPGQLSGRMKKRCGIARAFYRENRILLIGGKPATIVKEYKIPEEKKRIRDSKMSELREKIIMDLEEYRN